MLTNRRIEERKGLRVTWCIWNGECLHSVWKIGRERRAEQTRWFRKVGHWTVRWSLRTDWQYWEVGAKRTNKQTFQWLNVRTQELCSTSQTNKGSIIVSRYTYELVGLSTRPREGRGCQTQKLIISLCFLQSADWNLGQMSKLQSCLVSFEVRFPPRWFQSRIWGPWERWNYERAC